jgi:hypothetical protein
MKPILHRPARVDQASGEQLREAATDRQAAAEGGLAVEPAEDLLEPLPLEEGCEVSAVESRRESGSKNACDTDSSTGDDRDLLSRHDGRA